MGLYPTSTVVRTVDCSTEDLLSHTLGSHEGWFVTFVVRQARLDEPDARHNELHNIKQEFWRYPNHLRSAGEYLKRHAEAGFDCYFGVHLYERPGRRLASRAVKWVQALWLDEDEGSYPDAGPEPTAIVNSSIRRRHLYWRLSEPIPATEAVLLNRRIAGWAGGDTGKSGLATILRAPETLNLKRYPRVDQVAGEITGAPPWKSEAMYEAIPLLPNPEPPPRKLYEGPPGAGIELVSWLTAAGVEVRGEVTDGKGLKLAIVCPWLAEHTGGDRTGTYVGQYTGEGGSHNGPT